MELAPISVSLGAMGSLAEKLDARRDTKLKAEITILRDWLVRLSKARDPPDIARIWMKDVRELSYDMESCLDIPKSDLVDRMPVMKARVKEAKERYHRYMLPNIPISEDVFSIIDHQLLSVVDGRKTTDPVVVEGGVLDRIGPLLTDGDEQRKVLSIVGAGGIGKTTLAKQLWRLHEPGRHFKCRAFVRTSKKPDMRRIFRSILAQVRPDKDKPPEASDVNELIRDLREHLRDKSYFLIIDDLWATSVWDVARRAFPEGNGSRILITTEVEDVALACCSNESKYSFDMQPLSITDSRNLFTNGLDEMLKDEIISSCGGLPLAIIIISSVMASQQEADRIQNREQIQRNLPTNTAPENILKQVLNFCYSSFPSGLQTCLLYLSLYPENYVILKDYIMKQWVAEDFIFAPTVKDKMKVAANYFDTLVDMGMIQHIDVAYSHEVLDYSDEVLYYAVHPTVHDFITSKSIEENFVTVIDYSQETIRLSNKVSRLSLQFGSATYASAPASMGLSQVRSLAFIGLKNCFPPISEFKLLRFLTLHMWADKPNTGVRLEHTSELVLLRSLQVTCNDTVHLPDLKQGPIHLETLEINARLAPIPPNIVQLRSWLHLRLGVGTELPDVTGTFENATVYYAISLDESSIPPDTVKTINLLLPITKIPKWVGHLTNLCILKFVVRELQSDGIINLQVLPLVVLSLRVQQPTRELIAFATGAFTALEYFGFRCGKLDLAFEKGAMPRLQRVKLGFNARRGEEYDCFLDGIKDISSIQKISVLIGSAKGAEETDLKAAESACEEAVGRHYSVTIIKRSEKFEENVYPSEQEQQPSTPTEQPVHPEESQVNILDVKKHSILGEHTSAASEQPRHKKQKPHEEFDPPSAYTEQPPIPKQDPQEQHPSSSSEQPQRLQQASRPSASTEQPPVRKQEPREQHPSASSEQAQRGQQDSVPSASTEQPPVTKQDPREQRLAASSEQTQRPKKKSETEIEEGAQEDTDESISRMPPPSAPSNNKNYFPPQPSAAVQGKSRQISKAERSMVDLQFGLTKAMVDVALSKALAIVVGANKLPQSARRDMMFIVDEFEMMRSSLNLLEECIEDELVWTWVKKIHELAYSVEDCMELVALLDKKMSLRLRHVRQLCLPCLPVMMLALDQAVIEIQQLKARIEDVSARNVRYNLMPVGQQQLEAGAGGGSTAASSMLAEAREAASRALILGRSDLTSLITSKVGDDLKVISVWGSGGNHGTASIIRKTYSDPEICSNFPCRAWLKIVHPLSPQDLIRRFMVQVCQAGNQYGEDIGFTLFTILTATQEDLFLHFLNIVTKWSYLVVLEGVSDMEEWHILSTFFTDRKKGSCIIVTTQQDEIASLCLGHPYQILELKQFSSDHSICALFKKWSDGDGDRDGEILVGDYSNVGQMFEIEAPQNFSYGKTPYSIREAADDEMMKFPLTGRESEMTELLRNTAMPRFGDRVISVWGMAGIGKSALVKNFYYSSAKKRNFYYYGILNTEQFKEYRWVEVSHPFNLRGFCRSLLFNHHLQRDPIEECRKLVSNNCCLIIIDGLRSKEEWDSIKAALVFQHSASVIIVITTEVSIATYCTTDKDQVFNVKGLQPDTAMDLFREEVQRKNPSSPLHGYNGAELQELILKCGGLPKVIVSIAALLATKTITLMDTVRSLNGKFMHHLETDPEYYSLRGLFDWMYNYFRTIPDSLKVFVVYLSIFPPGQNIWRRRLVRRWIAEGYLRDSEEESAVDKGDNLFSKLLDLNIIQQIPQLANTALSDTRMAVYHVNGFIHEYIISRRTEENFVFELGPNSVLSTQRTGRHLVILHTWDRDRVVFDNIDFSRLRSLTVFGQWESFFISKSMKQLQVLDLEDASGVKDEDLKKIVKQMLHLKFLSLRGRHEIFRLPNSLGDLMQMQTLDARHTSILTLPSSIGKLKNMKYIRVGSKVPASTSVAFSRLPKFLTPRGLVGVKVPRAIGKLTSLHTLGVINVAASGGEAFVKELKKLTQLRKLGVAGINENNIKEFLYATSDHVHLESLLVQLDRDSQGCLNHCSLPWENLQSLTLYGLQDELPMRNPLNKLRKFDLETDTLWRNDMEFLAKLPELCSLHLRVNQPEIHFHAEIYGLDLDTFEKMKILRVTCRSSRLNVTFGSRSMKNLQLLQIDCSSASYDLSGLDNLSELKEVFLKGTDDTGIKTEIERQLIDHPNKPTVKLGVLPRFY